MWYGLVCSYNSNLFMKIVKNIARIRKACTPVVDAQCLWLYGHDGAYVPLISFEIIFLNDNNILLKF